ncbi:hypothetical protein A9R00_05080, partial [Oleispira antarctica]
MHRNTQTISPYYQNVIIRGAKRLNYNTQDLLQAAGLPEASTERQSPEIATNLIRSVWQVMDDEFMGFTQQRCKQGVFAIMARQAIQCQTLREALTQGTHFYQTIRNDISLSFIEGSESDSEAVLTLQLKDESLDPDHF